MKQAALLLLLLLSAAAPALAQYEGPAVETCRAYARRELVLNHDDATDVVFKHDQNLTIERYTRKVGSQFVSSVLMGSGALLQDGKPGPDLPFICLLANEKRAVFFYWLPP